MGRAVRGAEVFVTYSGATERCAHHPVTPSAPRGSSSSLPGAPPSHSQPSSSSSAAAGRWNPSSSPLQPFDPRVAGLGDPDLEAVDAGLELAVRRDPDDEGVDEAVAAGRGRLLGHPAMAS